MRSARLNGPDMLNVGAVFASLRSEQEGCTLLRRKASISCAPVEQVNPLARLYLFHGFKITYRHLLIGKVGGFCLSCFLKPACPAIGLFLMKSSITIAEGKIKTPIKIREVDTI